MRIVDSRKVGLLINVVWRPRHWRKKHTRSNYANFWQYGPIEVVKWFG